MKKGIKTWPKEERPRELMMSKGPQAVSDAGLVAILLRSGIQGKDVVSFSRDLIKEFGGLGKVFSRSKQELANVKGLGQAKISQLYAALEIGRRILKEKHIQKKKISDSEDVVDYFSSLLKDERVEYFNVMYLDRKNTVIEIVEFSKGTIDKASVYPREVIRKALILDSCSLIFIHNHPTGCSRPSTHDIAVTQKMKKACASVDVEILDHIIIGSEGHFSFKNKGLL